MLALTRAVELVLPYERIIHFGTVAFDTIISSKNVVAASAMHHDGQYLI
eukprot:COSAG04_NODE_19317_length_419_cov_0.640625_1_plen_48_part_10